MKPWFDFAFALEILPRILSATWISIVLAVLSFALAVMFGVVLLLLRRVKFRLVGRSVGAFIEFIRSTPLIVQVYCLFFVLPEAGIILDPYTTGVLGLSIHYGCYMSEVFRSGLDSLPHGQRDASTALGFSARDTYLRIIVPQTIPRILAPSGNFLIYLAKSSPILATIGVAEIMFIAKDIGQENFRYLEPMTIVGIVFLILSAVAARCIRFAESAFGRNWNQKEVPDV